MKSILSRCVSWVVISSFLWSTLLPTLVFADIFQSHPEPAIFKEREDGQKFLRFNLNIKKLSKSVTSSPTTDEEEFSEDAPPTSLSTELAIPIGDTLEKTQALIDKAFISSIYQNLKIVEEGFSWTSYGIDFYLHSSGNLVVLGNVSHLDPLEQFHFSNFHGGIHFHKNFYCKDLKLTTRNVVQAENVEVSVGSLYLQIAETYLNKGYLSVSSLYFDDTCIDPGSLLKHAQFLNEGSFYARDAAEISGNGAFRNTGEFIGLGALSLTNTSFENAGVFLGKGTTTFGFKKSLSNTGSMIIGDDLQFMGNFKITNTGTGLLSPKPDAEEALPESSEKIQGIGVAGNIIFEDFEGEVENTGLFNSEKEITGHLASLINKGVFGANKGFRNLRVDHLINHETGILLGNGRIIVGTSVNAGCIQATNLAIHILESFKNFGLLDVRDDFATSGAGVFEQSGVFQGKKAFINNARFENRRHINQAELDLRFGDQVTFFKNYEDVMLATRSLLFDLSGSLKAVAVNEGFIETDLFSNASHLFVNRRSLVAKTWNQSGKRIQNKAGASFSVEDSVKLDADTFENEGRLVFERDLAGVIRKLLNKGIVIIRGKTTLTEGDIENQGTITFDGNLAGFIQRLLNSGDIVIKGETALTINIFDNLKSLLGHGAVHLTGQTLTNKGLLASVKDLTYNGDSLVSTPESKLQSERVNLTTTTPLVTQGEIFASSGASFTSPTLDQGAKLTVKSGKTEFNGELLANGGQIDVDELVYEGRKIINSGTLQANIYKRSTKAESVSNLGTFIVRSGGFETAEFTNKGPLELGRGYYTTDKWSDTGKSTIDKFSIRSNSLTLQGELDVGEFIHTQDYESILILGRTIIRSGAFKTKSTGNFSKLSLSQGHYDLGKLKNKTTASKIEIREGAQTTYEELDGEGGEIKTFAPFIFDPSLKETIFSAEIHEILKTHDKRCTTFKAIPGVLEKEARAKKSEIYEQTHSIVDALKYAKINTKRYASAAEMEAVLKAQMATELTKHIHAPDQQEALNLSSNPIHDKMDLRYYHFETLRLSEKLARFLTKLVAERGYDALNEGYGEGTEDHATLCRYTGLKGDLFLLWFRDVFEKHKAGFVFFKTPSLPDLLSAAAKSTSKTDVKSEIQKIFENHTQRCTTFNTIPAAVGPEVDVKKEAVYKSTQSITESLKDKDKVNIKRHATNSEREVALKAVIAAEITKHIHSSVRQAALDLSSQFPELKESDFLFGHFEILRLTERLSRTLINLVLERGYDALNNAFGCLDDLIKLCRYSGLQQEMFLIWFKEVFEAHKPGFPEPKVASMHAVPNATGKQAETPFKPGVMKAAKDFILKHPDPIWLAGLLKSKDFQVDKDATLVIEIGAYSSRDELNLPYGVHFITRDYLNSHKQITRGLTLQSDRIRNGIGNDHMGTMHSYGPVRVEAGKDGVDNRFGMIEGTEGGFMRSIGPIRNGFAKEQDETTLVSRDFPGLSTLTDYPFVEKHKKRNGAKMLVFGIFSLESDDDIDNDFGALYGAKSSVPSSYVSLKTPKKLLNKTGIISSESPICVDVNILESCIGDRQEGHAEEFDGQKHGVRVYCAGRYHYPQSSDGSGLWRDTGIVDRIYYDSDPGYIQSTDGDIYLNLRSGLNKGSYVLSPEGVYINGKRLENDIPVEFKSGEFKREAAKSANYSFRGPFKSQWEEFSAEMHGAIRGGKFVHADLGIFKISGPINAPTISINAEALEAKGISFRREAVTGNIFIDLGKMARKLAKNNPLFVETPEDGIQLNSEIEPQRSSFFNQRNSFSLNPEASSRNYLGEAVLENVVMYALNEILGTLNIEGKSGKSLIKALQGYGKQGGQKVKDAGHDFSDESATLEAITSRKKVCIVNVPYTQNGQTYQNSLLCIPESVAQKAILGRLDALISGNNIDCNISDATNLDEGLFYAERPDAPDEKSDNELPPQTSTERETHVPSSTEIPSEDSSRFPTTEPKASKAETKPKEEVDDCHLNITSIFFAALGTNFYSEGPLSLRGIKGISLESKTQRVTTSEGFKDLIKTLGLSAKGTIRVVSEEGDILLRALEVRSDTCILYQTPGNIFDLALMLEAERSYTEYNEDGTVLQAKERSSKAATSRYTAPEVTFDSGDTVVLTSPYVRSALFRVIAQKGVTILDAIETLSRETEQHVSGKGLHGKDKEIFTAYQSMRSKRADFGDTKVEIILNEKGTVDLTNVNISDLVIDPKGGTIRFHLGKDFESFQRSEKSSNAFWQSQSLHFAEHHTGVQSTIGKIKVISEEAAPVEIMIESVRGKTAEFISRIESNGGKITESFWDEVHKEIHQKSGGPTAATAALIAIAVTAATVGTGAASSVGAFMASSTGFAGAGMATTMYAAGFTSLCTSAVMSLANNEGDPRKAVREFASKETLKSVGMTMLTAGITYGALDALGLPTDIANVEGLGGHAANEGVNMAVKMGSDAISSGRIDGAAVTLGAVAGTLGGYFSNKVGNWYSTSAGDVEAFLAHKTFHLLIGGGEGLIIGSANGINGGALGMMVAGAAGAAIAETVADLAKPTGGIGRKDPKDRPSYTQKEISLTQSAARFVAGLVATISGMSQEEIAMAMLAATTAVEHNFAHTALHHADEDLEKYVKESEDAELTDIADASKLDDLTSKSEQASDGRMSRTSMLLHEDAERAREKLAQADGGLAKFFAIQEVLSCQDSYDERQQHKLDSQMAHTNVQGMKDFGVGLYDFATDHPLAAAWMAGESVPGVGGFMTGGRTAKEWHAGDTAWYAALGETTLAFGGFIGKGVKTAFTAARGAKAAKTSSNTVHAMDLANDGGLNLFKWKDKTAKKITGWKEGDHFLYLPDQVYPKANWKQNAGRLREAMHEKKPIYDSFRTPVRGKRKETTGFLRAERHLLESRGWVYNPHTGAYHPPSK